MVIVIFTAGGADTFSTCPNHFHIIIHRIDFAEYCSLQYIRYLGKGDGRIVKAVLNIITILPCNAQGISCVQHRTFSISLWKEMINYTTSAGPVIIFRSLDDWISLLI